MDFNSEKISSLLCELIEEINGSSIKGENIDWERTMAAIWRANGGFLRPVSHLHDIALDDLIGIENEKNALISNTQKFLEGKRANNALLWGSRGTGKSSMIKALLNKFADNGLRVIQVAKEELSALPEIIDEVRNKPYHFIIFCDDLSFEEGDSSYVPLKSVLEGTIEAPAQYVLIYATSNRRHLLPEHMKDNLDTKIVDGEIHYSDTIEEKSSLADRFGLWLSFYPLSMEVYLSIVDKVFVSVDIEPSILHKEAKMFAQLRASRSGRTAQQFYNWYSQQD